MNRTVTPEETLQLFEFCEKKGVKYYDVRVELVDHLASDIEEQWKHSPEMIFKNVLKSGFKKFGKEGFTKLTDSKRKELTKGYRILLLKYFSEFYTWPKIILTALITGVLYQIITTISIGTMLISVLLLAYMIIGIVKMSMNNKFYRNIKIKEKRQYLFIEQFNTLIYAWILLISPLIQFFILAKKNSFFLENVLILVLVAFFTTSFSILFFGGVFYIPKKMKQHFSKQFPEFTAMI